MQKPEIELIIETIPDAVTILDGSGSIIYANRAAETILGLSRSEIKKHTFNIQSWKFTTPEGRSLPKEKLPFNQVMKSKKPVYDVVQAIEKPDGTRVLLSINAAPLFDENGEFESVVISFTDITEQRHAADEIRESRRQVLDILESITDAFYALDNDWRFTYVNRRAEELFGIRREQLLFRNIWQVIRKEQSPEIYEKYRQAKDEIAPVVFEDYSLRLQKWLEMHVYPYQNGISIYIKDVTDRKRAEEERVANLHFFESMDQVNRTILGTNDLKQMMSNVLDVVLSAINCDRAVLVYPCDPEAPAWTSPMERTRPEYPGVLELGMEIPMDSYVSEMFRIMLNSSGPVGFGPKSEYPLPPQAAEPLYSIKSFLGIAIYPKIGKPWQFGIHQCSYSRVWTPEEKRLFQETGRRIADGLSSLLIYRELQEIQQKYWEIFEKSNDGIFINSPEGKLLDINERVVEILGYNTKEELFHLDIAQNIYVNIEDVKHVRETVDKQGSGEFNALVKKKSGEEITVRLFLTATRDESGNITSYIGLVRDVTD